MKLQDNRGTRLLITLLLALLMTACAGNRDYRDSDNYYRCDTCGEVVDIRQVYVEEERGIGWGTVIGAVAGAAIGRAVSDDHETEATVGGAVAGGVVGRQIEKRRGGDTVTGWQIEVALDDGRYATVTQRTRPDVRRGDRVRVRGDEVYRVD